MMNDFSLLTSDSNVLSYNCLVVGNKANALKYIVLNHVENSTLAKLFNSSISSGWMDEVTCTEACQLLRAVQGELVEQESCCYAMVSLLTTEKKNLLALDRIITKIIFCAYEEGIISLLLACQLLVTSIDFKMIVPLNPKKIRFVRQRMHQLDYKNMRDLLKLLLVEKLDKMQCILTEHQHKQLVPIEELMIDLIDRKKNFCPALFFITEISRIAPNSSVHFLPRVSLKIREMVASFRPLAELGSMIGRTWMYPITTQVGFSWALNTCSAWKLQEQSYRLYFKTHLPYSNENLAPQTYFQYILLKQPRGQDNLSHMLKSSSSSSSGSSSRIQCSEMIQILILEAMLAIENSDVPVLMPINQYNWLHLCHLITYALSVGYCSLHHLLPMLQIQLKNYHYHKAKGEFMWILLQFISMAKSKSNLQSPQVNNAKSMFDGKNRDLVLEIFDVLYPDEMVWVGCSTDCLNMVRFFAPASLWINLSQCLGISNPPPQKVQQHIEFLKSQLDSGAPLEENGVLAVVANTYSNNPEIFETHVVRAILKLLAPTQIAQHWTLPHGRRADSCTAALDLVLLDSFTFHAKQMLYISLTKYVQNQIAAGFLPSPGMIETIARIFLTTEMMEDGRYDYVNRTVGSLLFTANKLDSQNYDLLAIYADLINYRLQDLQMVYDTRIQILASAFQTMCFQFSLNKNSQSRALYAKMEQIIMRQMMTASPVDLFHIVLYIVTNRNVAVNWFIPDEIFNSCTDSMAGMFTCPEIERMCMLHMLRAHKILAANTNSIITDFEYIKMAQERFMWPNSAVKWFPAVPHGDHGFKIQLEPDQENIKKLLELSDEEYGRLSMNSDEQSFADSKTLFISIFKCIFDYAHFIPFVYKILAAFNARDLIINTNNFMDYIIWRSKSLYTQGGDHYEKLVLAVNEMLFSYNVIPIERFLLALVLHPNDDSSIEYALLLLSTLIKKHNNFMHRIHNYCSFAPLHSNSAYAKSEDYFTKLADYYKKYPEYTYLEHFKRMSSDKFMEAERHLPIYYDNMPERILPIVDVLFQRSLEIAVNTQILMTFLNIFSPLYKFHPQPLTFLYKTMHSLDGLGTFSHTPVARQFVIEIVQKIDEERNPKYLYLTQEFMLHEHKMPVSKFCDVLVERIIAASTYLHQPPPFVVRDWRFSEFPPAAQALTGAWVELMASPHSAKQITEGLINLAMRRPIQRPFDVVNAIGLILTGLPSSFQNVFFEKVEESFDWPQIVNGEPSMLFEMYNQEVYLYAESRILSMLALIHSFCQHAGNNSLAVLPNLIADVLAPKVENETQLMYFLRILVPYLQRISDKEKLRHMSEYLKLIISIYNVLGRLVSKIGQLKYEDTVCDLLYQFKYMFVGYSLKNEAEEAIEKLPESMREKLKFLLTHSSSAETFQQQQQMMMQQQQQHSHHQQQHGMAAAAAQHAAAVAAAVAAQQQHAQAGGRSTQFPSSFVPGMPVPGTANATILQQLAAAGMLNNITGVPPSHSGQPAHQMGVHLMHGFAPPPLQPVQSHSPSGQGGPSPVAASTSAMGIPMNSTASVTSSMMVLMNPNSVTSGISSVGGGVGSQSQQPTRYPSTSMIQGATDGANVQDSGGSNVPPPLLYSAHQQQQQMTVQRQMMMNNSGQAVPSTCAGMINGSSGGFPADMQMVDTTQNSINSSMSSSISLSNTSTSSSFPNAGFGGSMPSGMTPAMSSSMTHQSHHLMQHQMTSSVVGMSFSSAGQQPNMFSGGGFLPSSVPMSAATSSMGNTVDMMGSGMYGGGFHPNQTGAVPQMISQTDFQAIQMRGQQQINNSPAFNNNIPNTSSVGPNPFQ